MAAASQAAVATIDREKLARILGMMGSSHDGEVLAAARAAEQLRSSAGLMWSDILRPATTEPVATKPKPAPKPKPKASTASTGRPKRRRWPKTFDLAKPGISSLRAISCLKPALRTNGSLDFWLASGNCQR